MTSPSRQARTTKCREDAGLHKRQSRCRPKAAHSIQELARKHAPEAIKTLADIAKKGTQALAFPQPLPYLTAPMASHRSSTLAMPPASARQWT